MEEHSTTTDTDGRRLFAGEAWFDPIEAGIRDRVRGFIEELLEQELTAALGGRSKHERAVEHHQGYRNGTRERQLTGSFVAVPLSVPRARLADKDGGTREWRSEALPRYARRTRQVEALIDFGARNAAALAEVGWCGDHSPSLRWVVVVPFKANAERRHHIPKQRHCVTNSAAYDAALRQRGSLTVWFTDAAIAAWKAEPRTTRGGQSRYLALAIATALTLKSVFRLALRQTEGLIGSIIALLGLDLALPDHTTLSRRAESLDVVRPRPGSGAVHLLVDSTGLKLCGSGEWAAREARHQDPAVVAQAAHRRGRRHWTDRRGGGHHQRGR